MFQALGNLIIMVSCVAAGLLSPADANGAAAQDAPPVSRPGEAAAAAVEWHRYQLPSGVRVIIVHAPAAKKQTTFSFQPLTIANDDAGRAQWSHLLEHMLIRTTDAEGLAADGIIFNGETTEYYLRLETMAEPAKWKEALERHAKWLTARTLVGERLARERQMIALEEQGTAGNGQTGKFALAAWNQVVTHGRAMAKVHGDVQEATIEELDAYARKSLRLDSRVLIATIGPTPVKDIRAEIARLFDGVNPDDPAGEAPARDGAAAANVPVATQPQSIVATWDLPTRHVLWWWPLPDDRPQTCAAATGVSRGLMLRVRSKRDVAKALRSMLPYAVVTTERGSYMVLNACIAADAKPEMLTAAVREAAAGLCDRTNTSAAQAVVFGARMAAQEFMVEPDFALLARQVQPQMKDMVEGLWLLGLMNYEFAWGVPAAEAHAMLMNLDAQAVAEVLGRLRQEPGVLVLEPEVKAAP